MQLLDFEALFIFCPDLKMPLSCMLKMLNTNTKTTVFLVLNSTPCTSLAVSCFVFS